MTLRGQSKSRMNRLLPSDAVCGLRRLLQQPLLASLGLVLNTCSGSDELHRLNARGWSSRLDTVEGARYSGSPPPLLVESWSTQRNPLYADGFLTTLSNLTCSPQRPSRTPVARR